MYCQGARLAAPIEPSSNYGQPVGVRYPRSTGPVLPQTAVVTLKGLLTGAYLGLALDAEMRHNYMDDESLSISQSVSC